MCGGGLIEVAVGFGRVFFRALLLFVRRLNRKEVAFKRRARMAKAAVETGNKDPREPESGSGNIGAAIARSLSRGDVDSAAILTTSKINRSRPGCVLCSSYSSLPSE